MVFTNEKVTSYSEIRRLLYNFFQVIIVVVLSDFDLPKTFICSPVLLQRDRPVQTNWSHQTDRKLSTRRNAQAAPS